MKCTMIPLGSTGGSHSKVTEEAVTFATVTFCGGSNGSENKTQTKCEKTRKNNIPFGKNNTVICQTGFFLSSTCKHGGKSDVDHHSFISFSGPAGDGGIVLTLRV